jgi:hypothetical protein
MNRKNLCATKLLYQLTSPFFWNLGFSPAPVAAELFSMEV